MAARRATARTNSGMVDYLRKAGYVNTERVADVMQRVDRRHYVRHDLLTRRDGAAGGDEEVYCDTPQRIGYDVTISAPHMHALTLEMLAPMLPEGAIALDVGSGSGYLTACLMELTGPSGRVVGVERVNELVPWSIANLERDGKARHLGSGRMSVRSGDGSLGAVGDGPFAAIHVGAAAPRLPEMLVEQLARPGRLVVPVGPQGQTQELRIIDKDKDGNISSRSAGQCMFVPLYMTQERSAPANSAVAPSHATAVTGSKDAEKEADEDYS